MTNTIPNTLVLSQYDQARSTVQIYKFTGSSSDELELKKCQLLNIPSDGINIVVHDSVIVLQSDDRTTLRVIDYLQPFLQ